MDVQQLIQASVVSFIAFVVKGITGTGTTTVIVGIGSLFLPPKLTIVLASLVNITGGLAMLRVDPVAVPRNFWLGVAVAMVLGSIGGAWALSVTPQDPFLVILGVTFLYVSVDFIVRAHRREPADLQLRSFAAGPDLLVGLFAGFCGGFVGVNAPPLVHHFGKCMDKRILRRFLVLIFIPAALWQSISFYFLGQIGLPVVLAFLAAIPTMFLGISVGNWLHGYISEHKFRVCLGVVLLFAALQMLIKAII